MNLIELQRALRQLRLGGIATVLETRLHQAQAEPMAPIDLIACLVNDELTRRSDRLLDIDFSRLWETLGKLNAHFEAHRIDQKICGRFRLFGDDFTVDVGLVQRL